LSILFGLHLILFVIVTLVSSDSDSKFAHKVKMVKPSNKRKNEHSQDTSSNKVLKEETKTSVISIRDMKKLDLIKHCEALQALNEKLLKENEILRTEIQENNVAVENPHSKITKIENNQKDEYGCHECDYVAYCIHDYEDHSHSSLEFECYHCSNRFETKHLVMMHTKSNHEESVPQCVQYLESDCTFGDHCWYIHDKSFKESTTSIKCN